MVQLSDQFTAVAMAIGLGYWIFYKNPVRWKRMTGCFLIMIVSIGLGVVSDDIPMAILMWTNIAICGLKFLEDVGTLLGVFKAK